MLRVSLQLVLVSWEEEVKEEGEGCCWVTGAIVAASPLKDTLKRDTAWTPPTDNSYLADVYWRISLLV